MNQFLFGVIALLMMLIALEGAAGLRMQAIASVAAPAVVVQESAESQLSVPEAATSTPPPTSATALPASPPVKPAQAPGTYTLAQVAAHASTSSCYTAINGAVYDVTPFIREHPGGAGAIRSLCGIDGSDEFNGQHGGQRRPASELVSFKIGTLI